MADIEGDLHGKDVRRGPGGPAAPGGSGLPPSPAEATRAAMAPVVEAGASAAATAASSHGGAASSPQSHRAPGVPRPSDQPGGGSPPCESVRARWRAGACAHGHEHSRI
eukprot:1614544-Lingulodinium_polyedra.AAC.1